MAITWSVDASLNSATIETSRKRYGCTAVVNEDDNLVGIVHMHDIVRAGVV